MSINLSVFIPENTKQYITQDREYDTLELRTNVTLKFTYQSVNSQDCELFIIKDKSDIKKYKLENSIGYVLYTSTEPPLYEIGVNEMNYGPHSQYRLNSSKVNITTLLSLFVDKIQQTVVEYQFAINLVRKSVELQSKNLTGIKGIGTLIGHNVRQSRINTGQDSSFFNTYQIDKIICMKWEINLVILPSGYHYIYFQIIKSVTALQQFYDQIKIESTTKRTIYLALIQDEHQKCREWCLKNKIWVLPQVRLAVIHEFTNQTATSKYPSSSIIEKAVEQINNLRLISRITKDTGDENSLLSSIKALDLSPEQLKL